MDHDALPSATTAPISHRIADVNQANLAFLRHSMKIMARKIGRDHAYESNATGHFAWDVSLMVRAACLGWRVTREPQFLEHAAAWSRHMIERTDEALGVVDWRGRTVPAWSAGSRYTAGTTAIGTIGGAPIHLQAAAEHLSIEQRGESEAVIHVARGDGSTWSSPVASLCAGDENYLPDLLARRSASLSVLVRGLPAPVDLTGILTGDHELEPQFAAHLVHTGLIARSLLATAETLEDAPRTVSSAISPAELYEASRRALFVHDADIRTRFGKSWYITPEDFPGRRLGLDLPHNHVADAATSFLILGRRFDDKGLHNLGASLTQKFVGEIDAYMAGALRHPWFYYPLDSDVFLGVTRDEPMAERTILPVQRGEDSSHATLRVRALAEWKALDPNLVSDEAMSAVALAFRRYFMTAKKGIATLRWLPGEADDAPRGGTADSYPGAWGSLAPWDSTIKRRINSMAYRHHPTAIYGATVLSSAEILAMNKGIPTYASSDRNAPA